MRVFALEQRRECIVQRRDHALPREGRRRPAWRGWRSGHHGQRGERRGVGRRDRGVDTRGDGGELALQPDLAGVRAQQARERREQARTLMKKAGYGPDKPLPVKIFTRNIGTFRDPAMILADHLKEIYFDAELDVAETPQYYNRVFKKDYQVGMNATGFLLDDPDQAFPEHFGCESMRNYMNYCNREVQALVEAQSVEFDKEKRRQMVWEIERRLNDDVARPVVIHGRQAGCWQSWVKNYGIQMNSIYNAARLEDVWLDKPNG